MGKTQTTSLTQDEITEKLKRERALNSEAVIIPAEEVNDPKHRSRIAHKSCNPVYFKGELVAFSFSGKTESVMKNEKEERLKKLQSNI